MPKRNICVVITDKAHLSRVMTLLKEVKRAKEFNLQIAVGAGALTYRYGNVVDELRANGFKPDVEIPTAIEDGGYLGMAKTAALGMLEFASAFNNLKSDMVVIRGDRFEVLPIATAAAYLNKAVVHLEGGDVSGSIDESVRHAITKLAHLHFVTNKLAKQRIIKMGERRNSVWDVGSLDIDFLSKLKLQKKLSDAIVNDHGVGVEIDLSKEYLVVMQNPVTSEMTEARRQANILLSAVHGLGIQAVWIWPNLGAGADEIAKRIREWQVKNDAKHKIRFIRYIRPVDFANVINKAAVVVGNSSTGIKECGWLGVPAVNIGTRQSGRLAGENVINAKYDGREIKRAIRKQLAHGRYRRSRLYGNGSTATSIVRELKRAKVDTQKRLMY